MLELPSPHLSIKFGEQRFNEGYPKEPVIAIIYRGKAYPADRGYTRHSPPNILLDVEVYSNNYRNALKVAFQSLSAIKEDKTLGIMEDDVTISTTAQGTADVFAGYVMSFTVRV